jgi:hypothetical protein
VPQKNEARLNANCSIWPESFFTIFHSRVQHLTVAPLTDMQPLEPGLGDTLLKAFKTWLSK